MTRVARTSLTLSLALVLVGCDVTSSSSRSSPSTSLAIPAMEETLTESQRFQVFQELLSAIQRVDQTLGSKVAMLAPTDFADEANTLLREYQSEVRAKYGISMAQQKSIEEEGGRKGWNVIALPAPQLGGSLPGGVARPQVNQATARNALRAADVRTILAAVDAWSKKHSGALPGGVARGTAVSTEICRWTAEDCTGLLDLRELFRQGGPTDPRASSDARGTGYFFEQEVDGSLAVTAPNAEEGKTIRAIMSNGRVVNAE